MLTPEERGPLAAWAYDSRDRLNLSDAEVADAIPGPRRGEKYDPATIRKAETNDRHMSRPLWPKLTDYYTALARERGVALAPIPGTSSRQSGETPDLASALVALTDELAAIRLEREAWTRGVVEVLRSYEDGRVPEALLDALLPQPPVDAQP